MAILPDNEFYTFEDRNYINPQVSLDEQNAFIGNLRNTQQANTNQINTQTYNLGTAVPPSVGGLGGAGSYFAARYQTPQMNSLAANLKATAQAKALNDILSNEQDKMQKRYNVAYRASQVRSSNGNGTNTNTLNEILKKLGIDVNNNGDGDDEKTVSENPNKTGIIGTRDGKNVYRDSSGKEVLLSNPDNGQDVIFLNRYLQQGGNLIDAFPDGTKLVNGATYTTNGRTYMYIYDADKYPQGAFFRVEG